MISLQLQLAWGSSRGDGDTYRVGANGGFKLGDEGFLNLTAEYLDRGETNRAGVDSLRVSPPRVTQRIGGADMTSKALWFNSEIPVGSAQLYAFGGISKREANSSGFFRSAGDGRTIPALYPNGFLPTLLTTADDWSVALGMRGKINDVWDYDVSVNRGFSQFNFATANSANVSWYYEPKPGGGIFGETPTSSDDGTLRFKQLTFNADLKGKFDWGIGTEPLYLATGLESTDGESYVTTRLLLGAAVRFEDYSDTGQNQTGKLTARFNVSDTFSLRGSLSTGVRAPGIQQELFSQVSTTLGSGGVLTDTVTVRQDSTLSAAFGIEPLKKETSRSATLGFAYRPDNGFTMTVDFYHISIKDRIVLSGYVTPDGPAGCVDPAVCPARVLLASVNVGAANFFTNAIDTKTTGVDIVAQYLSKLDSGGSLVWDFGYGHNKTTVDAIHSTSTLLVPNVLFDDSEVTLIEKGLPHDRASVGLTYSQSQWRVGVNNTYFGPVTGKGFGLVYHSGGKWLTDLSVNYAITDKLNVTLGGNNVFNVHPDKWVGGFPFPELGFTYGWETLPFSLNGAYYYARMGWTF